MSDESMIPVIVELQELKREQEQIAEQIKTLEDRVKARMGESEVLYAGPHRVTWKSITSNRLDTKQLTEDLGKDTLAPYYKTTTSRRFTVV